MNTDNVVEFVKTHGLACGGAWAVMYMSAIRRGLPDVFKQLDDRSYNMVELANIIKANI